MILTPLRQYEKRILDFSQFIVIVAAAAATDVIFVVSSCNTLLHRIFSTTHSVAQVLTHMLT